MNYPSYIALYKSGELKRRVKMLYQMLKSCDLCPRECGVNRVAGELGGCKSGVRPAVSSHNAHMGEEPPITGKNGSGTIFFTNCTMKCVFCQNYPISQLGNGEEVTVTRLAGMMLSLQKRGCHNINFVTPSHYAAQIVHAILIAVAKGLNLPIVYNTSGFDSLKVIKLLEGVVEIYLPDMKYDDDKNALKCSRVSGYKEANMLAVAEMIRQVGNLKTDERGIAVSGVIIRHLVLPDGLSGSKGVLKQIAENFGTGTYISLMNQYFPAYKAVDDTVLKHKIDHDYYHDIVEQMENLGFESGWIQEQA